ncbi:TolB-like translocation protein [Paenibacillus arenilitoris]|uniref:TolB protein n=1 Tax=Paenibacillus arenilitoris TaxID=2772299 RepID=A0A927CI79_9BACL|nr:hypothetical protein [Paenibacillus arenilitoris]MBD2867098.1 hypothetical protein [Paenibacillus arenilitoris]
MKNAKKTIAMLIASFSVLTACQSGGQEGKITVVDDPRSQGGEPAITVETVDPYENMEIHDWLDEETVLVSKENESLNKLSLAELSDSYPRSLYWYHLDTKQYELLVEREKANVGGASLSPDKKHLIYQEYTLGDPSFHVMNLDTKATFDLSGEPIAGAVSAKWADDETIIGAAYSGTAYTAKVTGEITALDRISEEGLFIVSQMNGILYYNTNADPSLRSLDLAKTESDDLGLDNVSGVFPSPDGKQMLVMQHNGSRIGLKLCDTAGKVTAAIAEGTELGGVSWSPDQRLIAYTLKDDSSSGAVNALYVYDLLAGESTRIAVNIAHAATAWSPSADALAYTEWNGEESTASIVHLNYSLQKEE